MLSERAQASRKDKQLSGEFKQALTPLCLSGVSGGREEELELSMSSKSPELGRELLNSPLRFLSGAW